MNTQDNAQQNAESWMQALLNAPDDGELAEDFLDWLSENEENQKAFGRLERLRAFSAEAAEQPVTSRPLPSPMPSCPELKHSARSFQKPLSGLIALAAVILVVVLAPNVHLHLIADHITGKGETRQISLSDGSTVHLGANSALAVSISERERSVELLGGAAFFEVRNDPTRPFKVTSNGVEARVLGTSFEVRETEIGAAVSVAEGSVEVHGEKSTSEGAETKVQLSVGERVQMPAEPDNSIAPIPTVTRSIAGWRRGELVVENWPAIDVFNALARHFQGVVFLVPGSASNRLINGVYGLKDPVASLRLVADTQGLQVRQVSPWFVVVSKR